MTIHVIARALQWRGESVLTRVALGAQREEHGVEGGVEPEPPRWKLLLGNGEVFVGPEYFPGEEVWPAWDGAKARFEEALDVEVDDSRGWGIEDGVLQSEVSVGAQPP